MDRREDVAAFFNLHRVAGVRKKFLPPQRGNLNILCDVQVNGHSEETFPARHRKVSGMARMFRKTGRASDRHWFGPMKSTDLSFMTGRQATFFRSLGRKSEKIN
ncbi:MAG: hypothetical protein EXS03_08240 [Phycisphaerales bacterium]|nr:hypothetical protein [Phycisphaerales bacterium]